MCRTFETIHVPFSPAVQGTWLPLITARAKQGPLIHKYAVLTILIPLFSFSSLTSIFTSIHRHRYLNHVQHIQLTGSREGSE